MRLLLCGASPYNRAVISAEHAYLFRHALLRDAAYELHLPADRARLHGLAFHLIEAAFGGRAPESAPLDAGLEQKFLPHATDTAAAELARHARLAQAHDGVSGEEMLALRRLYLRRAAEYANRNFQSENAQGLWLEYAGLLAGVSKGAALHRAGSVAAGAGRVAIAEPLFEQVLAIEREAGDRRLRGAALATLGILYQNTGRLDQAEQAMRQALEIAREIVDRRHEGVLLGALARLHLESGNLEQAEHGYAQVQAIAREVHDRLGEGIALGNLATVHEQAGRAAEAEKGYAQALAIHRAIGNRRFEGVTLGNLAIVYQHTGRLEKAEQDFTQALAILREVGNRRGEGIALGNLANVYQDTGRDIQAEVACSQALDIHRQVGNRRFEGLVLCSRSKVRLRLGQPRQAGSDWREGAALLLQLKSTVELEQERRSMREACARAGVPPFDDEKQEPPALASG